MIFVHIGLNKVASSTLQQFLTDNGSFLSAHGIIYPVSVIEQPNENRHSHAALGQEISNGSLGPAWEKTLRHIDGLPPETDVVLSSEIFGLRSAALLKEALSGRAVRIIVYVRDQGRLIVSRYSHNTKIGMNTKPFDKFFSAKIKQAPYSFFDYLQPWREAFGAANVQVGVLDKRTLAGGDVRLDLLRMLGVPINDQTPYQVTLSDLSNVSPGWRVVELIRRMNPLSREQVLQERVLFSNLAYAADRAATKLGLNDPGLYLNQTQIDHCSELFLSDLAKIKASEMRAEFELIDPAPIHPRHFQPAFKEIASDEAVELIDSLRDNSAWNWLLSNRR